LPPLTPVISATVPVIPVTVGVAEVVVMADHRVAQVPVQALTPELAVSLSQTYAVMPLPSTIICPSLPLAVAASGLAAGAFDADIDGAADAAVGVLGVVEQPARAITASAEPARVRMNLDFMMGSFCVDCVLLLWDESVAPSLNNGPHPPFVHSFSEYSADQFLFGRLNEMGIAIVD
jgi:hypothetical protein